MSKRSKKSRMRRKSIVAQVQAEKATLEQRISEMNVTQFGNELEHLRCEKDLMDRLAWTLRGTSRLADIYSKMRFRAWWDCLAQMIEVQQGNRVFTLIPKMPDEEPPFVSVFYSDLEFKMPEDAKALCDDDGKPVAYMTPDDDLIIPQAIGYHNVMGFSSDTEFKVVKGEPNWQELLSYGMWD